MRRGVLLLVFAAVGCVNSALGDEANPKVPFYGYGAIVASPNPAVVGEETSIAVTVGNSGLSGSEVEVTLSFNDWGITFGGWQAIDETVVSIPAGGQVTVPYTHVFENRGHHCLEVKLAEVSGGNTDVSDDRGQINLETVYGGDVTSVEIPVRNNGDKEVMLRGFQLLCPVKPGMAMEDLNDRRMFAACPEDAGVTLQMPKENVDNEGVLRLGAGEEAVVTVVSRKTSKEDDSDKSLYALEAVGAEVELKRLMVESQDAGSGETNHVLLQLVHAESAIEMLNWPLLCCIHNVRIRVLLESMLVKALELIEAGDVAGAIKMLKKYIEKATQIQCDLTAEEKACLEKAISVVIDAARTLASDKLRELGPQVDVVARATFQAKMASADVMRLAGQYEAACLYFFGVLIGLNNTKKDPDVPLTAILEKPVSAAAKEEATSLPMEEVTKLPVTEEPTKLP